MIATRRFHLTKKTYLNIFFNALKKNTLNLIYFIIIWSCLLSYYAGYILIAVFSAVFIVMGLILILWFLFKNLKPFFTETQLQFDEKYMYLNKNGTTSRWSFGRIQKVITHENHWLIYLSMREYIYIPKHIFHSEEDQYNFKTYINA